MLALLAGSCSNGDESIETGSEVADGEVVDGDATSTVVPSTVVGQEVNAAEEEGPLAAIDHWHNAYLIHNCGTDLPPAGAIESPDGIHTHGDGLVHIHPFNPSAAGANATVGKFVEALGGELTDEIYSPGFAEEPTGLSEADGCDGEDAVLQLAFWEDAQSADPPIIITENLADRRFTGDGSAYTLALLPAGSDIPKPPPDRLASLAEVLP